MTHDFTQREPLTAYMTDVHRSALLERDEENDFIMHARASGKPRVKVLKR